MYTRIGGTVYLGKILAGFVIKKKRDLLRSLSKPLMPLKRQ
jgi:hypothetical protein